MPEHELTFRQIQVNDNSEFKDILHLGSKCRAASVAYLNVAITLSIVHNFL